MPAHFAGSQLTHPCSLLAPTHEFETLLCSRDNLRGFFEKCFPNLLKRIFGYGDYEASWLNVVTKVGA